MSALIWLHEDALRADHPVFSHAPGARACFIFDEQYLAMQGYSYKRLLFIYECLADLPVTIYRGETQAVLASMLAEHQLMRLCIPASLNPWIRAQGEAMRRCVAVEWVAEEPFVVTSSAPDLRRFSRYWAKVSPHLLKD